MDIYADRLYHIQSLDDISMICQMRDFFASPSMVIGRGSNLLFTHDYHGTVLVNMLMGREIVDQDNEYLYIRCGSGEGRHELVMRAVGEGYCDIENLALIPGSVGAAVVQNIGAYGVEMQSVVQEVIYRDLRTGLEHTLDHAGCRFGYRESVFKSDALAEQYPYITSVTIRLRRYDISTYSPILTYGGIQSALTRQYPETHIYTPTQVMETIIAVRQSKLPDRTQIGTAGSFFVNPVVSDATYSELIARFPDLIGHTVGDHQKKLSAGQLIDVCGRKGYRIGDAGIYTQHALVLVNYGNATGEQMQTLVQEIQESVYERFGVRLETEVEMVG